MQNDTEQQQRREYRRPADPQVVASVPESANGYFGGGQDFGNYSSQIAT